MVIDTRSSGRDHPGWIRSSGAKPLHQDGSPGSPSTSLPTFPTFPGGWNKKWPRGATRSLETLMWKSHGINKISTYINKLLSCLSRILRNSRNLFSKRVTIGYNSNGPNSSKFPVPTTIWSQSRQQFCFNMPQRNATKTADPSVTLTAFRNW